MKKTIIFLILLCFQLTSAQEKALTAFVTKGGYLGYCEIQINNIHFKISPSGDYIGYYSDNTEGSFSYYDDFHNDATYGKLKSEGALKLLYWDEYNFDGVKYGKLKSVGDITLDYWKDETFDKIKFKKLKNIGSIKIEYYDDEFSDKHNYGKIRKIGNVMISYRDNYVFDSSKYEQLRQFGNTTFDYWDDTFDKSISGKLKSVNGKMSNVKIILN